jgi:hypothetical protein
MGVNFVHYFAVSRGTFWPAESRSTFSLKVRGKNLWRCVQNRDILHLPWNFAFNGTNYKMLFLPRQTVIFFLFSAIDHDFMSFSSNVYWVGTLISGRVDQSIQNLTNRYKIWPIVTKVNRSSQMFEQSLQKLTNRYKNWMEYYLSRTVIFIHPLPPYFESYCFQS